MDASAVSATGVTIASPIDNRGLVRRRRRGRRRRRRGPGVAGQLALHRRERTRGVRLCLVSFHLQNLGEVLPLHGRQRRGLHRFERGGVRFLTLRRPRFLPRLALPLPALVVLVHRAHRLERRRGFIRGALRAFNRGGQLRDRERGAAHVPRRRRIRDVHHDVDVRGGARDGPPPELGGTVHGRGGRGFVPRPRAGAGAGDGRQRERRAQRRRRVPPRS